MQLDCKKLLLYMHYCDEDSYEEISAAEVIREGHISMRESAVMLLGCVLSIRHNN